MSLLLYSLLHCVAVLLLCVGCGFKAAPSPLLRSQEQPYAEETQRRQHEVSKISPQRQPSVVPQVTATPTLTVTPSP